MCIVEHQTLINKLRCLVPCCSVKAVRGRQELCFIFTTCQSKQPNCKELASQRAAFQLKGILPIRPLRILSNVTWFGDSCSFANEVSLACSLYYQAFSPAEACIAPSCPEQIDAVRKFPVGSFGQSGRRFPLPKVFAGMCVWICFSKARREPQRQVILNLRLSFRLQEK